MNNIGIKRMNNAGKMMEIIDYQDCHNVFVKFDDGTIVKCSMNCFRAGEVKNPNSISVCGVGIVGNKYPIRENKQLCKEYLVWSKMLERCYKNNRSNKNKSYIGCSVCKEWLYYPNFYEWLHSQSNYEKWKTEKYTIDKDIIQKGNKIYEPSKCCLVPYYINLLLTNHKSARGKYPVGVIYNKRDDCFDVIVNDGILTDKKKIHLYGFQNPTIAFYKYKELKEKIIKERAKQEFELKNITEDCYNALLRYKIEITD